MTFQENLILATLSEWQGSTLSAEQVASIINVSDVGKGKEQLESLSEGHTPVLRVSEGYTIPKNSIGEYIVGMTIFTAMFSASLFLL